MSKHPNSRTVTIFQSGSFLAVAQGKDVRDFFSGARKSIGSYFEKGSSQKIGSGLSFDEEKVLLPDLLEVPADHPEFRRKVADFFKEIATLVPYDTGVTLEVGLENSNTDKVSATNFPINLMDYIRYRHAIAHPQVAASKEEAQGNQMKLFYLFDKVRVIEKNSRKLERQDAALAIYQEVNKDEKKMAMALMLLGVDPNKVDKADHRGLLKSKAEQDPDKFIEVLENKDFETNYWIEAMITHKVIKKMGAKYFDTETDRMLGQSLEEVVYFFRDDMNSDVIISLKARLQDKMVKA